MYVREVEVLSTRQFSISLSLRTASLRTKFPHMKLWRHEMEKEAETYAIDKMLIMKIWHDKIALDNVVRVLFVFSFLLCFFFLWHNYNISLFPFISPNPHIYTPHFSEYSLLILHSIICIHVFRDCHSFDTRQLTDVLFSVDGHTFADFPRSPVVYCVESKPCGLFCIHCLYCLLRCICTATFVKFHEHSFWYY